MHRRAKNSKTVHIHCPEEGQALFIDALKEAIRRTESLSAVHNYIDPAKRISSFENFVEAEEVRFYLREQW